MVSRQRGATPMASHSTSGALASAPASPPHGSARRFAQPRQSQRLGSIAPARCRAAPQRQPSPQSRASGSRAPPATASDLRHLCHSQHRFGSLSGHGLGSVHRAWQRHPRGGGTRSQPLAAVKQEQLPPGESRSSGGGGGGGLDRFFSNITGFPFPIGPNFVRRTIRYEASDPPP